MWQSLSQGPAKLHPQRCHVSNLSSPPGMVSGNGNGSESGVQVNRSKWVGNESGGGMCSGFWGNRCEHVGNGSRGIIDDQRCSSFGCLCVIGQQRASQVLWDILVVGVNGDTCCGHCRYFSAIDTLHWCWYGSGSWYRRDNGWAEERCLWLWVYCYKSHRKTHLGWFLGDWHQMTSLPCSLPFVLADFFATSFGWSPSSSGYCSLSLESCSFRWVMFFALLLSYSLTPFHGAATTLTVFTSSSQETLHRMQATLTWTKKL